MSSHREAHPIDDACWARMKQVERDQHRSCAQPPPIHPLKDKWRGQYSAHILGQQVADHCIESSICLCRTCNHPHSTGLFGRGEGTTTLDSTCESPSSGSVALHCPVLLCDAQLGGASTYQQRPIATASNTIHNLPWHLCLSRLVQIHSHLAYR